MNFKKVGKTRPEKSKLEKGWFGSKENNCKVRVAKKQRVHGPHGLSLNHF